METTLSSLSSSLSHALPSSSRKSLLPCLSFNSPLNFHRPHLISLTINHKLRFSAVSTSATNNHDAFSLDDDRSNSTTRSANPAKRSVLADLIQEIEPLDVSLIQKDVPPTTLDAMKRTISGMLGLLPSDRFQVVVEALWDPLSKLLVSSMMTGYTLRNAEYRLCLERNLDIYEGDEQNQTPENSKSDLHKGKIDELSGENELSSKFEEGAKELSDNIDIQGLGKLTREAEEYILHLQSRLSSVKQDLSEVKRRSAALQMQQFVGEEKNELLDYLRSLQPEKVAELSEPTCPELKESIHSVVHGLLATLSPRMQSKTPPSDNPSTGTLNIGGEDCAELIENTSLQFEPHLTLSRDYLARLLFWCMLLGHYLRGLEYRMELMDLLSLTSKSEYEAPGNNHAA